MRYQNFISLLMLGFLATGCAQESDAVAPATAAPAAAIEKKPVVSLLEVTGDRYTPGVMHPHEFNRGDAVRVIAVMEPPVKNLTAVWSAAGGVPISTPPPRQEASRLVFESGDTSSWPRGIYRVEIRAEGKPVTHTAFTLL